MDETKKCPFCAEEILVAAVKCKHCGERLDSQVSAKAAPKSREPHGNVLALLGFWAGSLPALLFISAGTLDRDGSDDVLSKGLLLALVFSLKTAVPMSLAFMGAYLWAHRKGFGSVTALLGIGVFTALMYWAWDSTVLSEFSLKHQSVSGLLFPLLVSSTMAAAASVLAMYVAPPSKMNAWGPEDGSASGGHSKKEGTLANVDQK